MPTPKKFESVGMGWIEYTQKTKGGKRYARWRKWEGLPGNWHKSAPKRVKTIPPLAQTDYEYIKQRADTARKRILSDHDIDRALHELFGRISIPD